MAVVIGNLNATLLHASKTFINVPWPSFTEHKGTVGRADVIAEYLRLRRMELEIQKKVSRSFDEDGQAFATYEKLIKQIDDFLPIHRGICEFFFRENLVSGRYLGAGRKIGALGESLIPFSEWGFLDFDYEKNSAYSTRYGIAYAGLEFLDISLLPTKDREELFRRGSATNAPEAESESTGNGQAHKPKRDKVTTQAEYQKWFDEYKRIKKSDSGLSDKSIYRQIKNNLTLAQSVETIARKIRELKKSGE
ncbi:MAG: hypothetical protein HQM04_07985 [Magnetococcales bacterium]|nr:hypothetical protein [Magnetococcales bacterium]MBF0114971.1 hypothetical protein [Magnetococcales bacterium]